MREAGPRSGRWRAARVQKTRACATVPERFDELMPCTGPGPPSASPYVQNCSGVPSAHRNHHAYAARSHSGGADPAEAQSFCRFVPPGSGAATAEQGGPPGSCTYAQADPHPQCKKVASPRDGGAVAPVQPAPPGRPHPARCLRCPPPPPRMRLAAPVAHVTPSPPWSPAVTSSWRSRLVPPASL